MMKYMMKFEKNIPVMVLSVRATLNSPARRALALRKRTPLPALLLHLLAACQKKRQGKIVAPESLQARPEIRVTTPDGAQIAHRLQRVPPINMGIT